MLLNLMKEDSLLGEYHGTRVVEHPSIAPQFEAYNSEIRETWARFKMRNPNDRDEPKLRVNLYEEDNGILVLHLGRGVSFANVVYSKMLCQERDSPPYPEETYEFRDGKHFARLPYSNVASVLGVLLFNPNKSFDANDPELRTVLSIRSKRAATNPRGLTLLVNGYVDIKDDEDINEELLEENLFRETLEEAYLTREEISYFEFIGPSQTRGKSCDLAWLVGIGLSCEEWKERWIAMGGQEESRGVLPVKIKDIGRIKDLEVRRRLLLRDGVLSDEARRDLVEGSLPVNLPFQGIYYILGNKLQGYFDRMKR